MHACPARTSMGCQKEQRRAHGTHIFLRHSAAWLAGGQHIHHAFVRPAHPAAQCPQNVHGTRHVCQARHIFQSHCLCTKKGWPPKAAMHCFSHRAPAQCHEAHVPPKRSALASEHPVSPLMRIMRSGKSEGLPTCHDAGTGKENRAFPPVLAPFYANGAISVKMALFQVLGLQIFSNSRQMRSKESGCASARALAPISRRRAGSCVKLSTV